MARLITALAALATALASLGCNEIGPSICSRDVESNPFVEYKLGTVDGDVYETSPPDGEYLYFPGGQHYALDHMLGKTPDWFVSYLSFDRYNIDPGGDGDGMPAGNEVEYLHVDDKQIELDNGTCVDFWLRVVAGTGGDRPSP